jgi:hypothetical protein
MIQDRRRHSARSGMATVGAIMVSLGSYVFQPMETLFTNTLARMEIEEFWGGLMICTGLLMMTAAFMPGRRILNWLAHAITAIVCGWTYIIMMHLGTSTPTINACLIISIASLATMLRDALEGEKIRGVLHGNFN